SVAEHGACAAARLRRALEVERARVGHARTLQHDVVVGDARRAGRAEQRAVSERADASAPLTARRVVAARTSRAAAVARAERSAGARTSAAQADVRDR